MCKIIGICARRGAGRKTAAWLLAQTMEEQRKGTPYEKYAVLFESWVKLVIIDPAEATSTDHVVLDSFGEHILDQVKQFCPALIDYDLHDEDILRAIYINPYTFEISPILSLDLGHGNINVCMAAEYVAHVEQLGAAPDNLYMTLGEFVMYFARHVMKRSFGPNVWLNIATTTASVMCSPDSRIYWDVKTQAELDYIKRNGGIIIELRNADREHDVNESYRDIKYLDPDMILDTTLGLHRCAELFWNTAKGLK